MPGHGGLVDREFVEDQRNQIGIVAETIRDLALRGDSTCPAPLTLPNGRSPASTSSTPCAVATSTFPTARSASRSSKTRWRERPAPRAASLRC